MSSAWKSFTSAAKAHHESVNAAYSIYYGAGTSPSSSRSTSVAVTPRPSFEAQQPIVPKTKSDNGAKKAWKAVKKHAKEHHDEVNTAYQTYYGAGALRMQ